MSADKIRELNDTVRTTMTGGRVMMTAGVDAVPSDVKAMVIRRVATFSDFTPDNDPYHEHDFGNFEWHNEKVYWKIDYYDRNLRHWQDPLTEECRRILTVLLASEY